MGRTRRLRLRKRGVPSTTVFRNLDADAEHIALMSELRRGGWRNDTHLKVGEFSLTGRGIYARRDFRENDLLIELPVTQLISMITVEEDAAFCQLVLDALPSEAKVMTTQCLLALYILYLQNHGRHSAYIATIPKLFSVPYFCPANEIAEMIPEIRQKVRSQQETIQCTFTRLERAFASAICGCCGNTLKGILDLNSFEWAYFAVNSRTVYFDTSQFSNQHAAIYSLLSDAPRLAMAPFLDLLNHTTGVATRQEHRWLSSTQAVYRLFTKTPVRKYEQIFISYGALDNVKLLVEYGFFIPNNPHDLFDFDLDEIEAATGTIPYKIKMFLKNHDFDRNLFVMRDTGLNHNLLAVLHIVREWEISSGTLNDSALTKIIYGDMLPVSPIAKLALKLLEGKVEKFRRIFEHFEKCRMENQLSENGEIFRSYLEEALMWLQKRLKRCHSIRWAC